MDHHFTEATISAWICTGSCIQYVLNDHDMVRHPVAFAGMKPRARIEVLLSLLGQPATHDAGRRCGRGGVVRTACGLNADSRRAVRVCRPAVPLRGGGCWR